MKKKLNQLIENLKKRPDITFAYLFGSRAMGYSNKNSDWDLAVYFSEPMKKLGLWPAFKLEAELSRGIGAMVQVLVLNESIPPVLGFEIVKSGVILLNRDENLRMDFEIIFLK